VTGTVDLYGVAQQVCQADVPQEVEPVGDCLVFNTELVLWSTPIYNIIHM